MNERGIATLYGRWLIEGAPRVLLFDTGSAYKFLNEWKGDLWNIAGIPGPDGDHESNEAIVFGYLIAWFLGARAQSAPGRMPTITRQDNHGLNGCANINDFRVTFPDTETMHVE